MRCFPANPSGIIVLADAFRISPLWIVGVEVHRGVVWSDGYAGDPTRAKRVGL